MSLKGYLVPVTAPDDSLQLVEAENFRELCKQVGIEYGEIVHGDNSYDGNFVAIVDEDGVAKGMVPNFGAAHITGYRGYLYGPCLIVTQSGPDLVSLNDDRFRYWCKRLSLNYTFH